MSATEGSDAVAGLEAVAEASEAAEATTADELSSQLTEASATADAEVDESSTGETESTKGRDARSRIQELVGANKQLTSQLESLKAAQDASQQSINNLTDLANQARQDSEIVQAIRTLAADPRYTEMIHDLDRALSGEEPEVDTSKMSDEERVAHEKSVLEQRLERAEEMNQQIITDSLITRADQIADRWLDALPEEYTEADREVIGTLWTHMVDWDGLEATGDPQAHLEPHLRETLQQAIDLFQQPRGGLVEPGSETTETEPVETQDPVEALQEALAGREYGTVQNNEGKYEQPISDDEFLADFAAVMKARQD